MKCMRRMRLVECSKRCVADSTARSRKRRDRVLFHIAPEFERLDICSARSPFTEQQQQVRDVDGAVAAVRREIVCLVIGVPRAEQCEQIVHADVAGVVGVSRASRFAR